MKTSTLRSIGIIVSAHGLQGEVSIKPWDEDASWVGYLDRVYVFRNQVPTEMTILSARIQGGVVIVKFDTVKHRDEAEKLRGAELKVLESSLPDLEEGEFYADELTGMAVKSNDDEKLLGTILGVLGSDAGDFLEVQAEGLSEPVLVPFQDVFVPRVDKPGRTVFIRGLDSLFEES
jgi:16S rRNA processing protein RimM